MVFHRCLNDSKSPLISRTILSILADLNIAVVRIVSIHPLISNSSSPLTSLLGTVLSTPPTCSTVSLDHWHALSTFSHFTFFYFHSWTLKFTKRQVLVLLLIIVISGLLAGRKHSVCISKSKRFFASYFLGQIVVCAYILW